MDVQAWFLIFWNLDRYKDHPHLIISKVVKPLGE